MPMTSEPKPIWQAIKHLRDALIEAEWEGDAGLAAGLRQQITRLEMLQSYGETHDVEH
jgi:hypothetical protein